MHEQKNTRAKTLVIAGVIAVTLALAVGIYAAVLHGRNKGQTPAAQQGIEYDDSAVEGGWESLSPAEIEARLNEKVAEGMINISCNTSPYFEDGRSEGNVMIVNEPVNRYPQRVEFIRSDTGETVYASKAIPVGSKIERAALDVALPAGQYTCTALFHNLDPVSGAVIGTAGAIITITVKN